MKNAGANVASFVRRGQGDADILESSVAVAEVARADLEMANAIVARVIRRGDAVESVGMDDELAVDTGVGLAGSRVENTEGGFLVDSQQDLVAGNANRERRRRTGFGARVRLAAGAERAREDHHSGEVLPRCPKLMPSSRCHSRENSTAADFFVAVAVFLEARAMRSRRARSVARS
jgi:hypothetical protein